MDALHDNALLVATLPLLLWMAWTYLWPAWWTNAWPEIHFDNRKLVRRGIGIVMLMLGFMALRNLPGWPFDWLKPLG